MRLSVLILFAVLGVMASDCFGQLFEIRDVKATTVIETVTTKTLQIDGNVVGVPEVDDSQPAKSKTIETKAITLVRSMLDEHGPAHIEFEHPDGTEADDAFDRYGDTWLLTKYGRYRVRALAWNKEDFKPIPQKDWVELSKPGPGSDAAVAGGLHVLVVYESANASSEKYVTDIIGSPLIRNYVRSKSESNGVANIRFWDQHVKVEQCHPVFCNLFKRERSQVPWVVIRNDASVYEGPLPVNVTLFLELLKRYGG